MYPYELVHPQSDMLCTKTYGQSESITYIKSFTAKLNPDEQRNILANGLGSADPVLPARTVLEILYHLSPQIVSGPFQGLSLRCCAKTPPCFSAVLFRTTHFDPVFLLILWFSPSVSPCSGLTNRNWVLPSVPYIYRSSDGQAFCLPPACLLVCWTILRLWRWRRYVPPKRRVQLYGLHGVISQKMIRFKTTTVKTSNPTHYILLLLW
jgi:hypothetical protein